MNKILAISILLIYILLRMVADPFFWRNISEYYAYAFEVIFVTGTYFLFRREITLLQRPARKDLLTTGAMIICGFLVYKTAGWMHHPVPFDLSSYETIFLLVIFGPVLEELIFRMALWQAFESLCKSKWLAMVGTTFLFAAGHFSAYWFVPEQFQGFVIYQTAYVILLGVAVGIRRYRSGAVSPCIFMHCGFNLGFFLASRF